MRPTPDEVTAGIRALLKQEIAPSMPAHAQPQLKRIMAVLRDGRWNEAGFDLLRENAVFAELARACAERIGQQGDLPPHFPALAADLHLAADHRVAVSFAEANEVNRKLRDALCRCMDAVRDIRLTALDDLCSTIGSALLALREQ